jgi:23S rRNA (cytidine1920-2'-O)/16S rRNA (cytidine1409-2'-O)-methyltransferase
MILAGDVLVNGVPESHAGARVGPDDELSLKSRPRFVSRGGEKLDFALESFAIDVSGPVCADVGASTGGFTDCLLQRGASRVYAIDVGYGQLDSRLRDDSRVVSMERVNARYVEKLPEQVDLAVVDVSFISLNLILPVVWQLLGDVGTAVPLIKPQFEAGKRDVGRGGVVKDPEIHRKVLEATLGAAEHVGFAVLGLVRSPLVGPAGNVEFLAHLEKGKSSQLPPADYSQLIRATVPD